jgi:hypothetical protein
LISTELDNSTAEYVDIGLMSSELHSEISIENSKFVENQSNLNIGIFYTVNKGDASDIEIETNESFLHMAKR